MIKYIGSKRTLVPSLVEVFTALRNRKSTVLDLFSGTSRVGYALKGIGYRVLANDLNTYAATIARCYVEADSDREDEARKEIQRLNKLPGREGYFTSTFCQESRFFQPKNGARIDAIRDAIAALSPDPELEAVLLTSLMEAADRVDSTVGLQMAYLKDWASRSYKDLELRVPELLPQARAGKGKAYQLEALDAAKALQADVVYIDPPYNQHKYLGNYHIWETLVRWDFPDYYGVACKRVDCKERRSAFNSKPRYVDAFRAMINELQADTLVLSMSNEGFITRSEVEEILGNRGKFITLEIENKRYVGSKIGIYSPEGVMVGTEGKENNTEYVFVAGRGLLAVTSWLNL